MGQGWRDRLFGAGRPGLSARPPEAGAWSAAGVLPPEPLPPLPDGDSRANQALSRAGTDLPGAIAALEGIAARTAPDPAVLHALCLLLHRAGRLPDAIAVARRAVPVCFKRGRGLLVAEIFETLEADAEAIGLGRQELLALGGALARTPQWPVGFRALATALLREPEQADAAQELLRLSDRLLGAFGRPDEALRTALFVGTVCADDALRAEAVARGAAAERALGAPARATGPHDVRHALSDLFD